MPAACSVTPDQKAPAAHPLAPTTVNFAGDAVAVVVARNAAIAKGAVEKVEVDYTPLDPVLDMEAARTEGTALVHPDLGTNRSALWRFDSSEAGTGRRRRGVRDGRGRPGPGRRQAALPPAA